MSIKKIWAKLFWKDILEYNPRKLDSYQNFYPTIDDNFPKIKYKNNHINYYFKNKDPKIVKPVGKTN
jgi:hypothetical protein